MAFVIRPVRPEDAPSTARIVGQVFAEYGMTFAPESWDKDLTEPHLAYAEPGACFFVAERADDCKIIGMAGAHLEPTHAELHRLYIDPAARGLGLGQRLCQTVEAWASSRDVHEMRLWSDFRFCHAHALYRNRGYRIFSSRTIDDPDRSVEFGMKRDLRAAAARASEPLTENLQASLRWLEENQLRQDPALLHQARFAAAGILDSRTLAQPVPELQELFAGQSGTIEAWVGEARTVVGFRLGDRVIIHPSARR